MPLYSVRRSLGVRRITIYEVATVVWLYQVGLRLISKRSKIKFTLDELCSDGDNTELGNTIHAYKDNKKEYLESCIKKSNPSFKLF